VRASVSPLVALGLAALCTCGAAHAEDTPPFRVPVAMKGQLQSLLNAHGSIELEAQADYRTGSSAKLVLASGQRIVGGWNTRVPRIEIPGGVSRVFIAGVRSDDTPGPDVDLTGGAGDNDDIDIIGGSAGPGTQVRVRIRDGAHIHRLRLSEYGGLEVQQSSAGYVRDSTFTRLLGYWPSPYVQWSGNLREPSSGNAFLGISSVTPLEGSTWTNAGDLWLVAWDCESWNLRGLASPRCFTIDGSPRVVSVGLAGGTAYPQFGGALASWANVPALVSWFQHGAGGTLDDADVLLRNVGALLSVQPESGIRERHVEAPEGATWVRLFQPSAADRGDRIASVDVPGTTAVLRSAISAALGQMTLPHARTKPARRVLVDILGPAWRDGLSTRPDSSPRIQAEIDASGVAKLPAGIYYLDRPLKIGARSRVEGVVGEGRDSVYLVAKGAFPVIQGRGDFGGNPRTGEGVVLNLVISGLTLYGGTYGLHLSAEPGNLGRGGVVAWSQFSELKLMRQSVAGVNVSGIGGIDSNIWYRVDFFDVPIAFRGNGSGSSLGMSYADKQHFLDCQYQNVSDTVWYWTTDRASGGDVWTDNYYSNVGRLIQTRAATNLLWNNSVMEDVAGPVAIDVTDYGTTATYYFTMIDSVWRGRGPPVVTDTQSWQVGTLFVATEFAQSGGTIVADAPGQSLFAWGSRITGSAGLGRVQNGMFIDSSMGPFDSGVQIVRRGQATEQ